MGVRFQQASTRTVWARLRNPCGCTCAPSATTRRPTRASSTRRPVPDRPGRWNLRHLLHLRTNPWHVSQTLIASRLSQENVTVSGSPHVCLQGSGPSLVSRGGGGKLAAHTRLALRSLASRASRRLRIPRRSLARVTPSTPHPRRAWCSPEASLPCRRGPTTPNA